MFQIGEYVVHKVHGICEIMDIVTIANRKYYKVTPSKDNKLTIYVPYTNENDIIRNIMSEQEANKLIEYMKGIDNDLVVDSKSRRDEFARLLTTGNIYDIAFLAKKLYILREEKLKNNRFIGVIDQDTFENANNRLIDELSLSLKVSKDDVTALNDKQLR